MNKTNHIKQYLNDRGIDISLESYGRDYFTAFEIKSIVDNPCVIEDMYNAFPLKSIDTISDYYLFFLSRKITTFSEMLSSMINEDHKKTVNNAISLATDSLTGIETGMVIRFINSNIEDIFDDDSCDYHHVTIDYMADYCNGITLQAWEYLADKHGYLLLNQYDRFEKIIETNPHLFELIFKEGSLSEIESLRLETTLDVWRHICCKTNSRLKPIVEKLYRSLYEDMQSLAQTANIENVMIVERKITRFHDFLKRIRSPLANDFLHTKNSIDALLDKNISEKGQVFTYELPVKEIVEKWKLTESWEMRLLSITHDRKLVDGKNEMVSRLSADFGVKSSLMDFVSTNVPTDEYFKLSRQQSLSLLADLLGATLIGIISNPETLNDFGSQLYSAISFISERVDGEDEHLIQDAQYMIGQIKMIADNIQNKEIVKNLCYGASMYAIAFAEKILRLMYRSLVKDEVYVPYNAGTMGELLNESNKHIVEVFGDIHIRCLGFFLLQTPDNVGYNIRNSLAHWNDISTDSMNIRFFSRCLWLFVDIMNTIFWYCIKADQDI